MRKISLFSLFVLFSAALRSASAESVQFNYHLPQVGQQAAHTVQFDLDLQITLRQAGKIASSEHQKLSRTQERHVTVLQVAGDRATKVQVQYAKAQEEIGSSESGEAHAMSIEGKTYIVERRGSQLLVTAPDGSDVPDDERNLVAANMDSVGHSNQLGRFLHGKTVQVGETLQLPKEMAADLLGLREANGNAQKVELILRRVDVEEGRRLADFDTVIVMQLGSGSTLDVRGSLQFDVDTCHTTAADFSGPISSEGEQPTRGEKLEVLTDGTLKATVHSSYYQFK